MIATILLVMMSIFICSIKSAEVPPTPIPILLAENTMEPDGSFSYRYETADGIKAYEKGTLKEVGKEVVEVVEGGYEYTDPDGKLVSIKYIADETGFHPTGDIIPLEPNWVKNQLKFIEEHSTPQPLTAEKTT